MSIELDEPSFILMDDGKGHFERAHRWRNPNGSLGGWIADSAHVDPSCIIDIDANVMPGAEVGPGMMVKAYHQMQAGQSKPVLDRHLDP